MALFLLVVVVVFFPLPLNDKDAMGGFLFVALFCFFLT